MRAPTRLQSPRGEKGLTLVEALVAITVLLSISLGMYALLDSSNRLSKQETNVAEAQQSARAGIFDVSRLIREARGGQPLYGNATRPTTNNSPGSARVLDFAGCC